MRERKLCRCLVIDGWGGRGKTPPCTSYREEREKGGELAVAKILCNGKILTLHFQEEVQKLPRSREEKRRRRSLLEEGGEGRKVGATGINPIPGARKYSLMRSAGEEKKKNKAGNCSAYAGEKMEAYSSSRERGPDALFAGGNAFFALFFFHGEKSNE